MNRALAAIATVFSLQAYAGTSYSVDLSDMWWSSIESGWGANVAHQGDTLFVTFFVYGADGNPTWYVAPSTTSSDSSRVSFTGPLFRTTGSPLTGSFNSAATVSTQVGTLQVSGTHIVLNLVYTIDGRSYLKTLTRNTWRSNHPAGSYIGATIGTYSNACPGRGYSEEPGVITITGSGMNVGSSFAMTFVGATATCSYTSGLYTQNGRLGGVSGSLSCTNGGRGTYSANKIEVGADGFTAEATADFGGGCTWSGRIGGLRRN